jgi:drug/metabolite transporter (DMT)-like permease
MQNSIPYLGESLAIAAAIIWAMAVVFFKKSGETVHPIGLNLFKNFLALILILPTIWIFGFTLFREAPARDYLLILLSGALGIGISDTLFFKCLNMIGAGRSAIVACLYSPLIIVLSIIFLDERLTLLQFFGTALIISAVLTSLGKDEKSHISRRQIVIGMIYGALAYLATAVSVVIVKPILNRSPLLWVTEFRLIGGILVLFLVLIFHPDRKKILSPLMTLRSWVYTFSGSFMGAYLSMIAWLGAIQLTQASIAAALSQSSVIFIFVFAILLLHEPLDWRKTVGIILGIGGSILVIFG